MVEVRLRFNSNQVGSSIPPRLPHFLVVVYMEFMNQKDIGSMDVCSRMGWANVIRKQGCLQQLAEEKIDGSFDGRFIGDCRGFQNCRDCRGNGKEKMC